MTDKGSSKSSDLQVTDTPDVSVDGAKAQAKEIVLAAKEEALRLREEAEEKAAEARRELEKIQKTRGELIDKLSQTATLSRQEAEKQLMEQLDKELADEMAKRIREAEEKIRHEADKKARGILATALQRVGTEHVAEHTISTVDLSEEDMKGRIIGKEGRNIQAFEEATGVSVDIGEEGDLTVTVSSFDPVRREVARIALERLIADGRIQPGRIEEVVQKVEQEVDEVIQEAGQELVYRAGVTGLPEEIVKLLGRFKFRTSYGQSMIEHTLEVVRLAEAVAAEVNADVEVVKRAALLHDLGKAVSAETEKGHAEVGAEIARRYKISEDVVQAFEGHHSDNLPTLEAVVVYLADAISGARPGARREDYEEYVNRVRELETVARSFTGVDEAFAISAGREVRVVVNPVEITDAEMVKLAHDISHKIHEQLKSFPGQIKVNVIRQTRVSATVKPKA